MKIRIKKFCNIQNVTIETPTILKGTQGMGKSTILRSIYYLLNCADPKTGKRFDERIYSETARQRKEDDFVEVSGFLANKKLTRRSTPKTSRLRGSDLLTVSYNVESNYYIDDIQCNLNEYNELINNHFQGFNPELFLSTSGFLSSSKEEKRAIFEKIIGEYKDFSPEKNNIKSKISEIKKEIDNKKSVLSERKSDLQLNVKNPSANILLTKNDIATLQCEKEQIQENIVLNTPKLTETQMKRNKQIYEKVAEIEKTLYQSKMIDFSEVVNINKINQLNGELQLLKRNLTNIEGEEINENIDLSFFDKKIEEIRTLTTIYDNYDNLKNSYLCNKCHDCTLNCEKKVTDLLTIEELEACINELGIQDFEQQKEDYLLKKQSEIKEKKEKKEESIKRLLNEIEIVEKELETIEKEFNNLKEKRKELEIKEFKEREEFKKVKNNQIKELLTKLEHVEEVDFVKESLKIDEIDKEIEKLQTILNDLLIEKKQFDEVEGIKKNAKSRIETLSNEIKTMEEALINAEKIQIDIEQQEIDYFTNLQNKINNILPKPAEVSLFKNNVSKEGFKFDFELSFNNKLDFSTSEEMEQFIPFLQFLHKELNIVDVPICVDEFSVFTGDIKNFGNLILCVADKNVKELQIIKI